MLLRIWAIIKRLAKLRVITGKYKGRHFEVPRTFKARPTTDFAKENLFNVLRGYVDIDGAKVLDLFAGTGSITAEFLSRGSSEVTSVEIDREHFAFIRKVIDKLGAENCRLLRGDAMKFVKRCNEKFDIVFADPPYKLPEISQIPDLVLEAGILNAGGLLVLEHGKHDNFTQHPCFVDHRAYGSVNFTLFSTDKLVAENVETDQ